MKSLSSFASRPLPALKTHLGAAALLTALVLALTSVFAPSSALAGEADQSSAPAPLAKAAGNDEAVASDEGTQAVTIYHFEMMYYDDPTFEDMGVPELAKLRLIGTSTVEGLKPGDVVNAWDHVGSHPGFRFFDGWPREVTVSEDSSRNAIQLNYVRQASDVTVNYYEASLLGTGSLPLRGDAIVETIGGQSVGFTKLGSEVRPRELYADVLNGDELAEAAMGRDGDSDDESSEDSGNPSTGGQEYAYVGSYPENVFVSMDASKNEINLVYARPTAGPDHVEAESDAVVLPEAVETESDAVVLPDAVEVGSDAVVLPDSVPAGDEEAAPDDPASGDESAPGSESDGATAGSEDESATQVTEKSEATEANRAEAEAAAENGILTLPQTGDDRGLAFAMILVASGAAAVIATAAFRRILR